MTAYVAKAEEYSAAAAAELEADRAIAATSLAIHAGINAADAVLRCTDSSGVEKELRRLPPLKTRAEYEPEDVPRSAAARAVERADRCVAIARRAAPR